MNLQPINPLDRPNWDSLLRESGDMSFFHTSGWATVLSKTYGYKPIYFVSFLDKKLDFLMPMMEVISPFTGKRGVSLPFTDHCPAHAQTDEFFKDAVHRAIDYGIDAKWDYVEWRDARYFDEGVTPFSIYHSHELDLAKGESALFSHLKEANQRNIRKAAREGVAITIDHSIESVKTFYRLNCMTRRRHGLPPQPFLFFRNVFDHIIFQGNGIVVSAAHSGQIIASNVFFHFGTHALYKYGASDLDYQKVRPNNLLMWEAIKWYSNRGYQTLNLGRTEIENDGLLQYKRSWGAAENTLIYYRYDFKKKSFSKQSPTSDVFTKIFAHSPMPALRLFGRLFYKHVG
jgi:hypothetical protein